MRPLTEIPETRSLFRPSLFGAGFKLAISYRYIRHSALDFCCSRCTSTVSIGACSTVRGPSGLPRSFISQSRSASTLFSNCFQSWRIHWSYWGSGRVRETYLANRGYLSSGPFYNGCGRRSLEEWSGKHRERQRRSCVDEHADLCCPHIHECQPWSSRYPGEAAEHSVWNYKYALNTRYHSQNLTSGNTVVLTTIWVEIMSDPRLFNLRRRVVSRDHKTLAALALFMGGFCGRALLGKIGSAGALGIGVGFRILITISWIFVRGKSPSP
jgi:hypothetical protein